jgi:hypothetical protein
MSAEDWMPPIHFKELHLLPRTLFSMGAVMFVAGVIRDEHPLFLGGAFIIFLALALNFIVVTFRIGYPDKPRWVFALFNLTITLALCGLCFYLLYLSTLTH